MTEGATGSKGALIPRSKEESASHLFAPVRPKARERGVRGGGRGRGRGSGDALTARASAGFDEGVAEPRLKEQRHDLTTPILVSEGKGRSERRAVGVGDIEGTGERVSE